MSTCRPILFRGDMVQAVQDGRKTQTRRVVKGVPPEADIITCSTLEEDDNGNLWCYFGDSSLPIDPGGYETIHEARCPFGVPGDTLWVRETQWIDGGYVATDKPRHANEGKIPSIFMRRVDSRLTLLVEAVRVERVGEIDAVEAEAEGMRRPKRLCPDLHDEYILQRFKRLWDSINAGRGYGWEVNPWVFVVTFRKVKND